MMRSVFQRCATVLLGVFVSSAGAQSVTETYKLNAFDGGEEDLFGNSVDVDNGTMVVGATGDDDNGRDAGALYVYDVQSGSFIRKIKPNDGEALDFFGRSVIDQGIIAAGATGDDDMGMNAGAVYLFDAASGNQLHKIHPNDAGQDEFFGIHLAIGEGLLVVSSINDSDSVLDGAVYVFDVSTGAQLHKLMPNVLDPDAWSGGNVAIDDGLIVVGAPNQVYVFDANTGAQIHQIAPADIALNDGFGGAVDIHEGIIVVGSSRDDDFDSQTGSVYVFDAASGHEIRKITAFDAVEEDRFGTSVSIRDGIVAIGAAYDNEAFVNSGSVYLYNAITGEFIHKINQSDPSREDRFGYRACYREGYILVGMSSGDDLGTNSGSVYVFDFNCPADLNGDLVVNFFDISTFLSFYSTNNPAADVNGDGIIDFFDISAIIAAYNDGCPL